MLLLVAAAAFGVGCLGAAISLKALLAGVLTKKAALLASGVLQGLAYVVRQFTGRSEEVATSS